MKKFITVSNSKIEVNVFGNHSSPCLFLLAGWTHDFQFDNKFIRVLTKKYKIVTFSYPGYAGSEETESAQSIKYLASLIDPIILSLGVKNFIIVGFSMGAQVVLSYLQKHPKQKAILISPILHSLLDDTPPHVKLLLSSTKLVSLIRSIRLLKQLLVNKAYSSVGSITEGKKFVSKFTNDRVSLNGAYDTMIAAINSFVDPLDFIDRIQLIFGDKEIEKARLDCHRLKYYTIKDMGHGAFETNYNELSEIINLVSGKIHPLFVNISDK